MASENVTLQSDGTTVARRRGLAGGLGIGNVLIGLGVLALVAVIVFIVTSVNRDHALRTQAVTSAASDLAAPPPR